MHQLDNELLKNCIRVSVSSISANVGKFNNKRQSQSTLNLTKDIKDYYQKYKILCKEVRNMKDELNKFTMQYNVDWININSNLINLSNVINNIKNKNTVSLSATRSAEDTLQELRNKLKQTEIVLRDRKKIKENEFFRNIS
uniref:Uncharacterized protein n=1 Tax=Vespula pensylvanica TaxID=30213 RepID=A0A834PFS7_VESPE|nr:hypothetical protein H0235_001096 [Vespula pensylvanica]